MHKDEQCDLCVDSISLVVQSEAGFELLDLTMQATQRAGIRPHSERPERSPVVVTRMTHNLVRRREPRDIWRLLGRIASRRWVRVARLMGMPLLLTEVLRAED